MLILGLHKRDVPNVGDLACCPLDYVTLGTESDTQTIGDIKAMPDVAPDVVVLGGGAIAKYAQRVRARYPRSLLVAWGIGHTSRRHAPVRRWPHLWYRRGFALWGTRDITSGLTYAPCPSCLHGALDTPPAPQHDVVVFGHSLYSPLREACDRLAIPYMDNLDAGGVEAVLAFLASGRTVISSSYHGAYWGTLLQRRVAAVPFGAKFYSFANQPALVETVEEGILKAKAFPDALTDARAVTAQFEAQVRALLAEYAARTP